MVTTCFFFQGDKGDTGLRGLNGNAGVKVDRTVLSKLKLILCKFNLWPSVRINK